MPIIELEAVGDVSTLAATFFVLVRGLRFPFLRALCSLITFPFGEIRKFFTKLSKALNPPAEIAKEVLVVWLCGRKRRYILVADPPLYIREALTFSHRHGQTPDLKVFHANEMSRT
jgi:hypothetical protein